MNKRQFLILTVLVIVSGFFGGALSNWVFKINTAIAQEKDPSKEIISAGEFRIVDKKGKVRGRFALINDKQPFIFILGEEQSGPYFPDARIILGLGESGEIGLTLWDKNLKTRTILGLDKNGDPFLVLHDKNQVPLGIFTIEPDGKSGLALFDSNMKTIWKIP